jgi:hypothetical protein
MSNSAGREKAGIVPPTTRTGPQPRTAPKKGGEGEEAEEAVRPCGVARALVLHCH